MQNIFITTITGEDCPNCIKSLAETTRTMGGEWLKSKVIKIDGQFSAMMKVSIDSDKEAALKAELEKTYDTLNFLYAPARTIEEGHVKIINLTVDCEDRPGLTRDITKVLSDQNLTIENMEFHRFPVTPVGKTVYSAKMSVLVPEDMTKEQLGAEVESLSDCIRVSFD